MAATNNETKILDMLIAMQAEIASLKADAEKPAKPAKPAKPTVITVELETAKVPTLASVEKGLGDIVSGKCSGIVYPKAKHYETGATLSIHRCGQLATSEGRCKYHGSDNATRHGNFTNLHKRLFPAWESARKSGK